MGETRRSLAGRNSLERHGTSVRNRGTKLTSNEVKSFLAVARRAAALVSDDDQVIGEAADHAVVQLGKYWDNISKDDRSRRIWVGIVAKNHAKRVGAKLHRELAVGRAGSKPPPLYDEKENERVTILIEEMHGPKTSLGSFVALKVDFERRWALLSGEDRVLLHLKYVVGLSTKEIAKQRGLNEAPGTIDNKLTKAKTVARLVFEDLLEELRGIQAETAEE